MNLIFTETPGTKLAVRRKGNFLGNQQKMERVGWKRRKVTATPSSRETPACLENRYGATTSTAQTWRQFRVHLPPPSHWPPPPNQGCLGDPHFHTWWEQLPQPWKEPIPGTSTDCFNFKKKKRKHRASFNYLRGKPLFLWSKGKPLQKAPNKLQNCYITGRLHYYLTGRCECHKIVWFRT